jgi:exodeoxyribonuclease-3
MPLKIATFNANSIRARLNIILDWLRQENPEVLCIQETKVQDKDFPIKAFEEVGYNVAYRGQKSYNGVAVVSRVPLSNSRVDLYEDGPDKDARFISGIFGSIPLVNVYVPQGYAVGTDKFRYKLRWLEDLFEHIASVFDPDAPLILTGDLNVAVEERDVYDPKELDGQVCFHPDERALLERFLDWGLVDVLREHEPGDGVFTFWDYRIPNALKRGIGWRIDYILATRPIADTSLGVKIDKDARLLEKPSDHTFLSAEFDFPC